MVSILSVFKLQLAVLRNMLERSQLVRGIVTLSGEPIRAAVLCLLLVSSAALAQPPEETKPDSPGDTFADLIPDFANTTSLEEMQAVVAKGIGSDDPETVESTLGQISVLAMMGTVEDFHDDIPDDFAEPHQRFDPLRRQLGAIPGLRERLIELVRDVAEEARPPIDPEVEYASMSETERRRALTRGLAAIALTVYFPQDPMVLWSTSSLPGCCEQIKCPPLEQTKCPVDCCSGLVAGAELSGRGESVAGEADDDVRGCAFGVDGAAADAGGGGAAVGRERADVPALVGSLRGGRDRGSAGQASVAGVASGGAGGRGDADGGPAPDAARGMERSALLLVVPARRAATAG